MKIEVTDIPNRRQVDGLAKIALSIPDLSVSRRLDISLADMASYCPSPNLLALDFLLIASSCYAADKLVPRTVAEDWWTRELEMVIPVSDPHAWTEALPTLLEALCFLSGDRWMITLVPARQPLYRRPMSQGGRRPLLAFTRPDAICLFSGGLDSLAGAIDLLASSDTERVLLVSHYDAPAGEQADLYPSLRGAYPRRVQIARTRVRLDPVSAPESTLRTRSALFLALGLFAANGAGSATPLYAYENGHIALNIPLTPSRAGSCSTRTMHPYFLDKVVSALRQAGLPCTLMRPFDLKTKGECVRECRNGELLTSLVHQSVSCSHPSRRQHWVRRSAEVRNCGYCTPCLIRRGAMHAAGIDDGRKYGLDVCTGELSPASEGESADDLRAMLDFIGRRKDASLLAADILRVASVDHLAERASMLERGFGEIRSLLRDKGNEAIQSMAGN